MALDSEVSTRQLLQIWQARQGADGILLSVLALATVVPIGAFVVSPGPGTACVLGVFLFALGMACARLVGSARKVARLCSCVRRPLWPEIIAADILDVYEHPGPLTTAAQSTTALWIGPADNCLSADPLPSPEARFNRRRSGR